MAKVFVVMGNDFPDSVSSDEATAEAFCAAKKAEGDKDRAPYERSRVYWRVYEFELDGRKV